MPAYQLCWIDNATDAGEVELKRLTLPHPTAPYRRQKNDGTIELKSGIYEAVFRGVATA